jgi:hypothetical protein
MSSNIKANEIVTIATSDIKEVIKSHHDRLEWSLKALGHRRGITYPLFLSIPGAGKSESGRVTADGLGRDFFDVRGGNILPSDVRLPGIDLENEVAKYLGNTELPFIRKDGTVHSDSKVMLVWDEILDASLPVQRIIKQGTNDNCIGNLHFPDDTLHVAFANGLDHGCHSERMPLSNANRTAFYEIKPSLDSFQEYLSDHPVGFPVLEAFLQTNADAVYDIEPKQWDGKSNFASFRTLTEFGMMIEAEWTESIGDPESDDYRREFTGISRDRLAVAKLNAILGYTSGKKAQAFLQIFEAVGSIEELLKNPDTCKIPSDLPTKWVIACKLVGAATSETVTAVMKVAERLMGASSFIETYVAKAICKQKPKLVGSEVMRRWMAANTLELCGRG